MWTGGLPDYQTYSKVMLLKDLACAYGDETYYASLYVPALS